MSDYDDKFTTRKQWYAFTFSGLVWLAVIGVLAALFYDPKMAFIVFVSAPVIVFLSAGPRPPKTTKKGGSDHE